MNEKECIWSNNARFQIKQASGADKNYETDCL